MVVHVYENQAQLAKAAAALFASQILRKPDSVLGLATGSTPIDTYKELVKLNKEGVLDFSKVKSFNLDEYVGLPATHKESYINFMRRNLFDHINIKQTHLPNGMAEDLQKECREYDEAIKAAGGVDLQLLGIGNNGHIGFNEPASRFTFDTGVVELTDSTIKANRRFFDKEEDVPRRAITMGIGTIMAAKYIMLLAIGEGKADAVKAMVEGDITPLYPASILKNHPKVVVLLDKAAASKLSL